MYPPQRIFTNFPREQLLQAIKELDQSLEVDRSEIGFYQILQQKLSATSVSVSGEPKESIGLEFMLREKDEAAKVIQELIRKEYDEINAKQEVIAFLKKLLPFAT